MIVTLRNLITIILVLTATLSSYAQHQDDNWCMGHGGGISFATTPPTTYMSKIYAIETTAAVSDSTTGDLLFYTDGCRVWDKRHMVMQNGYEVGLDTQLQSSAQGAVIVPFLNDKNKYYLFTIAVLKPNVGTLYYSVVDMTLNNGFGGVVSGQKKIKVMDSLTEAMVAIPACGHIWLVTQKRRKQDFYVFDITAQGFNTTPNISRVSYPHTSMGLSSMKASPDHKKLIIIGNLFSGSWSPSYMAIHDFDNTTGTISNDMIIDTGSNLNYYDCEFSANGKYLYTVSGQDVYQFDASLPTGAAISASKQVIKTLTAGFANGMQRREDGTIYVVKYEESHLDAITNANLPYPGCTYQEKAIAIGGKGTYRLPQKIQYPLQPGIVSTVYNETICNGAPLTLQPSATADSYQWQDGSKGSSHQADKAGTYWVYAQGKSCIATVDSFYVDEVTVDVQLPEDTLICKNDTITIKARGVPAGAAYQWSTGTKDSVLEVSKAGTYIFYAGLSGCTDTAQVEVQQHVTSSIDLGEDQSICMDAVLTLPHIATSPIYDQYLWSDGSTQRNLKVTEAGTYYVTVSNQCQTISDTITVTERNCYLFFPTAFTPNGDGKNDLARMVGDIGNVHDYNLSIVNRWGEVVFQTNDVTIGWDGNHKAQPAELGVYYYLIQYRYLGEQQMMKGDLTLLR